jgi:acetyl esterase/lipase
MSFSELHAVLSLSYGPHARQQCDVFVPLRPKNKTLLALFHGGWWTQGKPQDLRLLALHLGELGYACALIGTRLLGDGARHGQDIIDDSKLALAKALEEASLHGASAQSVIVWGSGSGSLTALSTAMHVARHETIRVRGCIACGVTPTLEPWDGCAPTVTKSLEQFANHARHLISPMDMSAELLPPLFLLHGDSDNEVPARLAQRLHARAIEANETSQLAVLSGLGHRFIENPYDRAAKTALDRIIPFIDQYGHETDGETLFCGNSAGNCASEKRDNA